MDQRIFDTIVIGGGQTGLTVGHELARTGRTFVILDASERVGDVWRNRWDSLVMFTPAGFFEMPGMSFPAPADHFVTKDEMAAYLESYAREMALPVLSGVRVDALSNEGDVFVAKTTVETFRARNVVVAMANYQIPKVPPLANDLDPSITQLHSVDYRNPDALGDGATLVVGMGNSGAEIGLELAKTRQTYLSGEPTAVIPFRIDTWFGRKVGIRLVRFLATRVLTTSTPIGRRVRSKLLGRSSPVVRVKLRDLEAAGVERVPRVVGVRDGKPELADGRTLEVENVVWCTGFKPGFDWIKLPVFGPDGSPDQVRGVVDNFPGLYFCGLFFQHSLWSETVVAMPGDARYIVEHLDNRVTAPIGIVSDRSTSVAGP